MTKTKMTLPCMKGADIELDFRQPQESRSFNGFPLSFRSVTLASGLTVWVPRGISRNSFLGCWRLYVLHEGGLITANIHDDPSPLASLEKAFTLLFESLKGAVSRYSVDQRSRTPGAERDPLIDTGFTGVTISRSQKHNRKRVEVNATQMVQLPDGGTDARSFYAGSVKEELLTGDLIDPSKKLRRMLEKAVAVRRYYNRMRGLGVYAKAAYKYDDVPADIRRQPVDLPDLDIYDIMDSYVVVPRPLLPRTTGGDPDALALMMLEMDLTTPQKSVWLEDRCIKFYRREVEGRTLYLPTSVFRARGEWRINVVHKHGIFTDSVTDSDSQGSFIVALQKAWAYVIAMYREHPAQDERAKSVKHPLLDTGIASVVMQPAQRINTKSGEQIWSFSLKVLQRMASGRIKAISVGYWRLNDLRDDSLREALCRASAMIAYREHLILSGASLDEALISKDEDMPREFWPHMPERMITADDLHYYIEQRTWMPWRAVR